MKLFHVSSVFIFFFSTAILLGCNSPKKNEKETEQQAKERKTEIKELKTEYMADSITLVNEAEWTMYKTASEIQIKANTVKIKELKKMLDKHGKTADVASEQYLSDVEKRNESLQNRIDGFKREGTDWKRFKSDFDRDLNQVHTSLKEFKIKGNTK
jgi:hypothetical protein